MLAVLRLLRSFIILSVISLCFIKSLISNIGLSVLFVFLVLLWNLPYVYLSWILGLYQTAQRVDGGHRADQFPYLQFALVDNFDEIAFHHIDFDYG